MITVTCSQWRHYGVAVLTVAIALLLKLLLRSLVGSTGLALFYAAVTISAWYGGMGPGLVATILSTLALQYLTLDPIYSPAIDGPDKFLRLGAFILVTLLIGSLNSQLRSRNRQLKASLQQLQASQEAKQKSEDELRLITDAVPVLIAYVDSQQYYRFTNKAYEDWFGHSTTEVCDKPVREVLGEAAYEAIRPQIEAALAGEQVTFEQEVPHKDGGTRYISATYVPQFGNQGDVEGFVGVVSDITNRRDLEEQLRQSEAQFRRLFESNIIGVFFPTLEGSISKANDAFLEMVGYGRDDLLAGRLNWKALSPPEYQELDEEKVEELKTVRVCTPFEKEYIRKDGSRVPILVGAALLEGSQERTVAFVVDLTERKQAEEERSLLLAGEQIARAEAESAKELVSKILESITDGFIAFDHEWRFSYLNHEGAQTLGRPAAQLLGKNLWDEFPELGSTSFGQLYQRAVAEGVPLELEDYYPPFDTWFSARVYPTEIGGLALYFRDISDRKQAEAEIVKLNESLDRRVKELETLLEVIPIGIGIAEDPQCHHITVNPAMAEQLRISPEDNASLSAPPDERPSNFKVYQNGRELTVDELPMQSAATHGVTIQDLEVDLIYDNGQTIQLLEYAAPLFDEWGQPRGSVGVFLNITERKKAEQEIQQLNESLEQRVRERTAQLEAANEELESFSYSVSHDLRAPLRHISGFVDLLQKHAETTLDATSDRYLKIIAQTTKQAGTLVDNLLAFSRMGRTEMRNTKIDMSQLLKEVQWELEPEANGRVVHWQIGKLPPVLGDPSMLRLVLRNLLENALKYTQTRTQTEIVIGSTDREGEVVFFIRDNGVGFDMRYAHKLFGVFQRLHSEQQFEGTGIGLANVRRIIHRHGGRTWAEGAVDGGATFYFSLPKLDETELNVAS